MNEKTCKKVRLGYSVLLGSMTVIVGALFIAQVLGIYLAGNNPIFTQERLAAGFSRISPAFWIWIVMIAGGFIVWEVFPVAEKRGAYKDVRYTLYRLKKRMPRKFDGELAADYKLFKREERKKTAMWAFVAVAGVACAAYTIAYLATPSNFPLNDVSVDVLNMVKHVMPLVAEVFVFALWAVTCESVLAERQLPYAKKLAAVKRTEENSSFAPSNRFVAFLYTAKAKIKAVTSHKYFILGVRITIGCVGAVFVILGVLNGNAEGVLMKAIKICLECIGIG